uniref:Uncharacterized protein n=1 Tax=Accipiter nisus TaxID=211598 RepID=A0A8B9NI36_9AVES
MDQSVVDHPVTLIIKAPNQKYTDQTINCFLDWTVGKLKLHLSKVYPIALCLRGGFCLLEKEDGKQSTT